MYLSHARSKDLVHWERLPEASLPASRMITGMKSMAAFIPAAVSNDEGVYKLFIQVIPRPSAR